MADVGAPGAIPLDPEQLAAADPTGHRWVAASAGTGKTQVLSSRVIRLLMAGARPESILCLTFTRAGAAEMQGRINRRLARWVRLKPDALFAELEAIGEDSGPDAQATARRLFARVLDAGGGGLQVQTIHGFCQSLLASFPLESGLTPGFEVMDDANADRLASAVLTELLGADARADGGANGGALAARLGRLSLRLGETGANAFLGSCARAADTLLALPGDLLPWLRAVAGLTAPVAEMVEASLTDEALPLAEGHALAAAMRGHTAAVVTAGERLSDWLAADPPARAATLDEVWNALFTQKGEFRAFNKLAERDASVAGNAERLRDALATARSWPVLAAYLDALADALEAGRAFAAGFAEAKRQEGLVTYDDLIADAGRLLADPAAGAWVRFKLDRRVDHILVDEAQDTNGRQWAVIEALAAEFFAGQAEGEPVTRTVFAVGDFKQAIFGFQGTDPAAFAAARRRLGRLADAVGTPLGDVALIRSFRSAPAVLALVDAVVARLGAESLGLEAGRVTHESATGGPGEIVLAPPVAGEEAGTEEDEEEGWLDDADRVLARRIARQIRDWIADELPVGNPPRPVRPGDILVLVRSRGPYVPLLVGRLHEEGVAVAGVDRLFLAAPIVVQDLLAAIRWVLQPRDDVALASLLVSPLIGWTQDELMARSERDKGVPLWRHLRATRSEAELTALRDLLARADFDQPYAFLERILSGPIDGRARLLARLGEDARDPLEELLNAAMLFEATEPPGLQRFLHWVERSTSEIKREVGEAGDAVRVLTVHGAKGLEAPVVVLADATRRSTGPVGGFTWRLETPNRRVDLPALRPAKEERVGPLADAMAADAAREAAEHQRLLYVALTRARERLFVVGKAPRHALDPLSWHASVDGALDRLGAVVEDDALWGPVKRYKSDTPWVLGTGRDEKAPDRLLPDLPNWTRRPAPPEARPPRPLAPSALGDDDAATRPLGPARADAIRRGQLLHALFERLPPVPPERRREAGRRWLLSRPELEERAADALLDAALRVIERPDWSRLWSAEALAEAPLTATVDGRVIAGTADRLLVTDDLVEVVDFKTGLAVPASPDDIAAAHLRQMAAYRDALRVLFRDRPVRAALLYTAGPTWLDLPDALLDRHRPGADNKM